MKPFNITEKKFKGEEKMRKSDKFKGSMPRKNCLKKSAKLVNKFWQIIPRRTRTEFKRKRPRTTLSFQPAQGYSAIDSSDKLAWVGKQWDSSFLSGTISTELQYSMCPYFEKNLIQYVALRWRIRGDHNLA